MTSKPADRLHPRNPSFANGTLSFKGFLSLSSVFVNLARKYTTCRAHPLQNQDQPSNKTFDQKSYHIRLTNLIVLYLERLDKSDEAGERRFATWSFHALL